MFLLSLEGREMRQPAPTDSGFKRCAQHQARLAPHQIAEERPWVTFQQRSTHLPALPLIAPSGMRLQRLVQSDRYHGRNGLKALPIIRCKRLLKPLQPLIPAQMLHPSPSLKPVPAAIGIEPQSGGRRKLVQ